MELIFMGTGTSQGVPMIACDKHGCDLEEKKNWRTRTSAHVVMGGKNIQIDAAPEFRLQCIWNQINNIDFFILTHGHADHVQGMDDLRRFCSIKGSVALPVYSSKEGLTRIESIYPYAARSEPEFKGYPAFDLREMPQKIELEGGEGSIISTLLPHGRIEVLGLVFEEAISGKRLAYYTDCKEVRPEALELAKGVDVLVIDGLRPDPHPTHLCISEAIEAAHEIGAQKTYLTHLTHLVDHKKVSEELPSGIELAYDGLKVEV